VRASTSGTSYTAPATLTFEVSASDTDGGIAQVEFLQDGGLLAMANQAPYRYEWTNVAAGTYTIAARATDTHGATTTLAPITITVAEAPVIGLAKVYFIDTDHLNTPRVITNQNNQVVWKWEQTDPFGNNLPDENPSGLGRFENNLRFPGQYFDKETGLHYNYFRDYDPQTGRYVQSDPIGLDGGVNTFGYVMGNPISLIDRLGLQIAIPITPPALPGVGNPTADANQQMAKSLDDLAKRMSRAARNVSTICTVAVDKVRNWFAQEGGNTNPYAGPVTEPVVVVDENGNAIPVDKGQRIGASPNGDYQEVVGADGQPTGDRMDRGGHSKQTDPRARGPHGHRPGVATPDGNPHLPIKP
jgi:RHS repeat-associated protein